MAAWEILVDNSSLPASGFDAWEHLNSPEGTGGQTIYVPGGVEAIVESIKIDVMVSDTVDAVVDVTDPIIANVVNVVSVAVTAANINAGTCK